MFYLNSIEQLENLVGLKEQLEVCLTCSRLLAAIQMLLLHQKLRCDSNKTTLCVKKTKIASFTRSHPFMLKFKTIEGCLKKQRHFKLFNVVNIVTKSKKDTSLEYLVISSINSSHMNLLLLL